MYKERNNKDNGRKLVEQKIDVQKRKFNKSIIWFFETINKIGKILNLYNQIFSVKEQMLNVLGFIG